LEFDQFGDFILQFGGTGSGPGQFQLPSGIWANNVGNLYVTDAVLNRVQKFDSCGHLVLQFGTTGTAPGFLDGPYGVTVDSFGYFWVADTGNNRVQAFDYTGAFVTQIGGLGGGNGQFDAPVGITVNATALQIASGESTLFVADTGSNRIQEFNITYSPSPAYFPSVAFNLKFGSHGNGNGQFNGPFGIVTDGVSVWVADSFNQRIQQFSVAGVFVQTFGGPFSYASPFGVGLPFGGIAVGLWAVDYNLNTVTLYSSAGAVILTFGVTGGGPGQLFHPTYIACGLNASQV
jgi:hypothetical protein